MITIKDIDIFKLKNSQAIIHQANCHCRMASGIARTIKELYPEAVAVDNATKVGDPAKLGTFTSAVGSDGKIIYNLYGQFNFGTQIRQTNYEAFYKAMESIHDDVRNKKLTTASLPYNIGCGLANGSWRIIDAMIRDIWEYSPVDLVICRYTP
jgi:O-acetyl-ADP-ribose deacetylase (regulator of RNase III)